MTRSASTAPEFEMSMSALLAIGSIRLLGVPSCIFNAAEPRLCRPPSV
jgi:hypothetical protein